jgi:hypothetical protein
MAIMHNNTVTPAAHLYSPQTFAHLCIHDGFPFVLPLFSGSGVTDICFGKEVFLLIEVSPDFMFSFSMSLLGFLRFPQPVKTKTRIKYIHIIFFTIACLKRLESYIFLDTISIF